MDSRAPGRPKVVADSADKRDTILRSARELFSDRGFDRTTMRAIAARAGVDPALIHHYFGNKNMLLVAALQPEVDAKTVFSGITPETDSPGEIFVRRVLEFWETNPQQRARAIALLRVAVTHDEIALRVRDFFLGLVQRALGGVIRSDHQDERYALVVSQTAGLAISKYILLLPDVANAPIDTLAQRVGPNIDNYLFSDFDE
ncbi:TetR family transcriptional regulator [Rhodococcus pseudokoreensis]|uniref:TetR family transcriptional regulator n=1 Tax=Rhodococcus pseudokoreensis TaxID=2811421 RepID=A0A974W6F0_9NOCA|nr:TetR family transcriptional regulator [Rhodococcus pseudokoreensis]QSE92128.1 TetR family transcriptional regulator [Rhodococcus pseudokoreensis]